MSQPTTQPTPPWKLDLDAIIAEVQKRASSISLGASSRVAIDVPGLSPVLCDRWEFESLGKKTKDAQHVTRAVALRTLLHDVTIALSGDPKPDSAAMGELAAAIPRLLKQVEELSAFLTRLGEAGDPALGRKFLLTRDNMQREADATATAFTGAGGQLPRAVGAREAVKTDVSSTSGAFRSATAAVAEAPLWKRALVPALFVLAIGIAAYNLRPRPDPHKPLNAAEYESIVPLAKLAIVDTTVDGEVTKAWNQMTKDDQASAARKLYEAVQKSHGAKRLRLYQPGGRYLAADFSEEREAIMPFTVSGA